MKIFITGCGGSGTTLLRKLFYAFENVYIIDGQIFLKDFVKQPSPAKFLVGKRMGKDIFSGRGHEDICKPQIQLIKKHDIKVLNIIRDGRDIFPRVFNLQPIDWITAIHQRDKYGEVISLEVRYEDLVSKPDSVQKILMWKFDLEKKHNFSDYPTFIPDFDGEESREPHGHGFRKINTESIRKGSTKYERMCRSPEELKIFNEKLKSAGYV